ncbi:MAG: hypothetical protein ACTSR8_11540 [Promethearchaeota archaeon]
MIQAIVTYQFKISFKEDGSIEPEFIPIQLVIEENSKVKDLNELINIDDLYGIYYQHTTWKAQKLSTYEDFYYGRLKFSPFQIISYYQKISSNHQYLTIIFLSLMDEISVYDKIIENLSIKINSLLKAYSIADTKAQIAILGNIKEKILEILKFSLFQFKRLSDLTKLQKIALIFSSEERLKILEILREGPISKKKLRKKVDKIKKNPNIDLLLKPFIELNLVRRDWIEGRQEKKQINLEKQGEYLFLVKDIDLILVPNLKLLEHLKSTQNEFYSKLFRKLKVYFSNYHPMNQDPKEIKKIASSLLNPDIYDTFIFLKNKFYPIDKFPNVSSEFIDTINILDNLKKLNLIVELKDKKGRPWIFLLTDIKPLIFFPEYILPKIREAFKSNDENIKITYEVAKKAFDLLEVSFTEEIEI